MSDFLALAIELQIEAYRQGDPSIASSIMTGPILEDLTNEINSLNQQGLISISKIDYYQSYIHNIRVIDDTLLELDTCEVWTTNTHQQSNGKLINSQGPSLLPQTITIEQIDGNWFITTMDFLQASAFCS